MKARNILLAVVALATSAVSYAQGSDFAGRLMGQSYFDITDMLRFAQTDYTSGTARSSSMGGAFTSLGADLSAMSINPAGLGMYQSSDLGITLSVLNNRTSVEGIGAPVYTQKRGQTPMKFNNIGFAFNVWEGHDKLTCINLGISYNNIANYNSTVAYEVRNQPISIADIFRNQLYQMKDAGITQTMMNSSSEPFNNPDIFMSEWGSVLAYQTEVVYGEENGDFTLHRSLSDLAKTNARLHTETRGSSGDFEFSVGGNVSNILYFGATLGVRNIDYVEMNLYEEAYTNNTVEFPINFMMYDQQIKVTGSGFNGKFGLTLRPFGGLRLGVAVHTPTYMSLSKYYNASMRAQFQEAGGRVNDVTKSSATNSYSYSYTTPTRLLTGLSYSFGKWAVLSADYERVWYNGMRLKNANEGAMASYKQQVRSHYKAANNYRIGLEIKPVSFLALRAGFGQQGNMLRDGVTTSGEKISGELSMFNSYDNPVVYKVSSGSAGIGLRFNAMYIDLAYTFNRLHYSQYMMYYFYNSKDTDPNNRPLSQVGHTANGEEILMSYKQSIDRHGVMLTFGVRF